METKNTIDKILDYAISREIQAHDLYSEWATRVDRPQMQKVLKEFATDELEHRLKLEAVKAGSFKIKPEEIGSLDLADTVEDVKPKRDMVYVEALILAMKKEKAAFKFYTKLADMALEQDSKELFTLLAQQEANHKLRFEIEYDLTTF